MFLPFKVTKAAPRQPETVILILVLIYNDDDDDDFDFCLYNDDDNDDDYDQYHRATVEQRKAKSQFRLLCPPRSADLRFEIL